MRFRRIRWTVLLTLLASLAAASGIAIGAEATLEDLGHAQIRPSGLADLLGPITDSGRTGWDCAPERAARAVSAREAELPAGQR
jgi:hypothetical protein